MSAPPLVVWPEHCQKHAGGDGACAVLEHFASMDAAMTWARWAATYERTRFLVRFDADRHRRMGDGWEAIQSWLRTM